MVNLLIDIGNSDIKTGICGAVISDSKPDFKVKLLSRYPYSKSSFKKDFRKNFKNINNHVSKYSVNKIGISVLQTTNRKFITDFFIKNLNTVPEFIDINSVDQIKIKYKKGLGNDRICNAVAAETIFQNRNKLIIDFGTATTYTLVSNKTLTGGMISPGIKTSLNSLISRTSLPAIPLAFPKNIFNDNTKDNIKSGVLYQSLFAAERVITEMKKKHGDLFVIATGGYSELTYKKTGLINVIDRNLVLKGINIIIS